ncbi:MAG: chemotaxis protein CheA [Deltaproteobacteria bacterium]|nr:chemotaxis protein CheA [Deltaproteobacteria bacterium]
MTAMIDDPEVRDAFLDEAIDLHGRLEHCLLALEGAPENAEAVNCAFRCVHTIKGNGGMLGLTDIADFSHAFEHVLARARDRELRCSPATIAVLLEAADVLKGLLLCLRGESTSVPPARDHVLAQLGALGENPAIAAETGPQPATPVRSADRPERMRDLGSDSNSIRVPIEKADTLVNLAGELAIAQSMVVQLVTTFTADKLPQLREAVATMERNARDLQERVMGIRMVPVRNLFGRFPRLVHDLAAQCAKPVALVVHGEDTELDKSVIEKVADPLLHLIRNAIDHGIEPPAERQRRGKPAQGTLTLHAYQQGGQIYVEVADDGRGLDRERIRRTAEAAGLVRPGEALSPEEIDQLIFRPGFSTAESVTAVSGRGVGMDVVKRNIMELGGTINITTEPGAGTRFQLTLPLTLAMLDGQLLQVGAQTYVIPLVNVFESLRPAPADVTNVVGSGEMLRLRGQMIPMLRLHALFGLAPGSTDPSRGILVVARNGSTRVALLADHLLEQRQVVIKSLETNFRRVPGIGSATILGDGRVALILDVLGLMDLARATRSSVVSEGRVYAPGIMHV